MRTEVAALTPWTTTHLHGAHTYEDSDGYPEAWTLPAARNIPAGYATVSWSPLASS